MGRSLKRKTRDWVTLVGDPAQGDAVEFHMRPASAMEWELALERAGKAARGLHDADDVRQSYGLDELPPEALVEDTDASIGVATTLQATELAMLVATDWRGFVAENGEPEPFTRRNVALAMSDWHRGKSLAQYFLQLALAPIFEASTEGKP
jgi:hypothetical protein